MSPHRGVVLLDFDGTLAPNLDLPDLRRRVIEFTEANGVPASVYADQYIVEIIDVARDAIALTDSSRATHYYEAAHALITDFEMAAASGTAPFPFTAQCLATLRGDGWATSVVTRNCSDAVKVTFPDIESHVDQLLARDQVEHLKPDPRHFSIALDAQAGSHVIVSDGAMDMSTGRELGLICVGVLTGSSDAHRLRDAGAAHVLDDISALPDLLSRY